MPNTSDRIKTPYNSRFAKAGVSCFYDSEVLNSSFVHLMKFSAENPRLRKAAKRYPPFQTNHGSANTCVLRLPEGKLPQDLGSTALKAPNKRTADNMG
jgi:hypothetical protein